MNFFFCKDLLNNFFKKEDNDIIEEITPYCKIHSPQNISFSFDKKEKHDTLNFYYFKPYEEVVIDNINDFCYITFNINNIEYNYHANINYKNFKFVIFKNNFFLENKSHNFVCPERIAIRVDHNFYIKHIQFII